MLYCPARSPDRLSSLLLGNPARSCKDAALSSTVRRRVAWSANPWKARADCPPKNLSVLRSLNPRIIVTSYVQYTRDVITLARVMTRPPTLHTRACAKSADIITAFL